MPATATAIQPVWSNPNFKHYKPPYSKVYGTVCVSAANRILLVKGRQHGKWSFPKGHKAFCSEKYLDCALRETMEETGIDLSGKKWVTVQKLSEGEYYFYELNEEPLPVVQDSTEVESAGWYTLEEVGKMQCNVDVNHFVGRLRRAAKRAAAATSAVAAPEDPLPPASPEVV